MLTIMSFGMLLSLASIPTDISTDLEQPVSIKATNLAETFLGHIVWLHVFAVVGILRVVSFTFLRVLESFLIYLQTKTYFVAWNSATKNFVMKCYMFICCLLAIRYFCLTRCTTNLRIRTLRRISRSRYLSGLLSRGLQRSQNQFSRTSTPLSWKT